MDKNSLAKTPPMGWNSWDCYGAAVNEEQLMANAEYIEKNLKCHGFQYVVCDIQWYEPKASSNDYNNFTELEMDEYSRLIPAVNRFPTSANGVGFKSIADRIHKMGLKFGIHIMRGIPRQAVHNNTKIKGTNITARRVAHHFSLCPWNTDMYGVNPEADGAQQYYNSLFELYASWGVDFVKCDDICNTEFRPECPYSAKKEIELIRKAIDFCGRDIVLSLSPGPAQIEVAEHLCENANMWRLTGDFWDEWDKLKAMFERAEKWYPFVKTGCWPDCDMLPLGRLSKNKGCHGEKDRETNFTKDEQITMLNLWCVFRSPLMLGGELRDNTEWDFSVISNDEVLSVNQNGENPRPLVSNENEAVWVNTASENSLNVALFNISDSERTVKVNIDGYENALVRDLWQKKDIDKMQNELCVTLKPHASVLYKITK